MPFEIRPIADEEFPAFARAFSTTFGETLGDEALEARHRAFPTDRSVAAFENGRLVGTAGSFASDLTLPGLGTTAVGAVNYVGVLPTHRRQGLLRRMMQYQLEDFHARGESLGVLTCSEGGIYGRFGYGPATVSAWYTVSRQGYRLAQSPEPARFRLIPPGEAEDPLAALYDRWRRTQPGDLRRPAGWWNLYLRPGRASENDGRFVAVRTGPDGDDACAIYRVNGDWDRDIAHGLLNVEDLIALTPAARIGMVDYLFGVDLIETVTFERRPLDDDMRWLFTDVRQFRTSFTRDWLWVRPIDLPMAMASRRYRVDDRLGIEVSDPQCPWNTGRWWVEGGPDGGSCTPAGGGQAMDLATGPSALGSVLLGGVTCSALVRAGLMEEHRPGAAARADTFVGTNEAPYCSTDF